MCFYPEEPGLREHWVEDRAAAVLAGQASDLAVGLRRAVTS